MTTATTGTGTTMTTPEMTPEEETETWERLRQLNTEVKELCEDRGFPDFVLVVCDKERGVRGLVYEIETVNDALNILNGLNEASDKVVGLLGYLTEKIGALGLPVNLETISGAMGNEDA